jgi:hypothetical protein
MRNGLSVTRGRSSELYQVDFVAALFGGFLLVWLSGVSDAEFAGNGTGEVLKPFKLTIVAKFSDAGTEASADAVPISAFNAGCAPPKVIEKLSDAGLELYSCQSAGSDLLSSGVVESNLQKRALKMADTNHRPQNRLAGSAFAFDIDVLFGDPSSLKPALFSGTATGVDYTVSEIGITPRGEDAPKVARIANWDRRGFFVSLTDGRPVIEPNIPLTYFYKFPSADGIEVLTNGVRLPPKSLHSIVLTLESLSEGSTKCWSAIIDAPNLQAKFEPC